MLLHKHTKLFLVSFQKYTNTQKHTPFNTYIHTQYKQ
jgi:hypothetical protein